MTDVLIAEAVAFLVALVTLMTPIIKLNVNIAKLTAKLEALLDSTDKQDQRITKHGEQIDELEKITVNHNTRLNELERRKTL